MNDLENCKISVRDRMNEINLNSLIYAVKQQVKDYFPMNEIPENIVELMTLLEYYVEILQKRFILTLDTIIYELEKMDGLE